MKLSEATRSKLPSNRPAHWLPAFKTILVLVACHWLLATDVVFAHESRPIFIQIKEISAGHYTAYWKIPSSLPESFLPSLIMPASCMARAAAITMQYPDSYIGQQQYVCSDGLSGQTLSMQFPIINPSITSLIQVGLLHRGTSSHILQPGVTDWRVPERVNTLSVAWEYLLLGIQHIFDGLDHLLFIACLLAVARTGRRILITITGFTLAHSLTLAMSTLRVVEIPAPPLEALIALSIAFLAHEIAVGDRRSWTWCYPIAVASAFGLLHGFGFAATLQAIGLPQAEIPSALLFFNLGVELGQIVFVCAAASIVYAGNYVPFQRLLGHHPGMVRTSATYITGTIAGFWFVERLARFWL